MFLTMPLMYKEHKVELNSHKVTKMLFNMLDVSLDTRRHNWLQSVFSSGPVAS